MKYIKIKTSSEQETIELYKILKTKNITPKSTTSARFHYIMDDEECISDTSNVSWESERWGGICTEMTLNQLKGKLNYEIY